MVLKQQLHQKQVPKLILAPALQQAIKLLPLTNLELIEIIDEELSQNPMLEIEEETAEKKPEGPEEEAAEKEKTEKSQDVKEETDGDVISEPHERDEDQEIEAYFQQYFDEGFRSLSYEKRESVSLENIVSKGKSLWDHLDWQANLTFFGEKDKEIAQYIIGNIDEDGYLTVSLEEISVAMEATEDEVEKVRDKIKKFDPVGVGSLTVQEALLTQMEHFGITDEITNKIVREHIHLLVTV